MLNDFEEEDDEGAKGANAVYRWISVGDDEDVCGRVDVGKDVPVLMAATFLNGLNSNMNTIPMLKI